MKTEHGDQWKLWLALFVLGLGGIAYIVSAPKIYKPCERPIEFSFGRVDPQIGVSRAELLEDMRRAAAIWNKVEGRTVLQYSENSALPVNFVYSTVQQLRDSNAPLIKAIDENRIAAKAIADRQALLERPYLVQKRDLQTETDSFRQALGVYNSKVDRWNSTGGAPADVRVALAVEKNQLMEVAAGLRLRLSQFNGLVSRINDLVRQRNALIAQSNEYAATINRYAGKQYVAGVYRYWKDQNDNIVANRIDVYEVADTASLITLLAHELGHALGLQHNANPKSIMFSMGDVPSYEQTSAEQARKPSAEDMAALHAICRPGDAQ